VEPPRCPAFALARVGALARRARAQPRRGYPPAPAVVRLIGAGTARWRVKPSAIVPVYGHGPRNQKAAQRRPFVVWRRPRGVLTVLGACAASRIRPARGIARGARPHRHRECDEHCAG
jgi:hypothetical protein